MGVLSCGRAFASDHMKYTMRIERLWVARLIALWLTSRLVPAHATNHLVTQVFVVSMCVQLLHCHHTNCGDGCKTHNKKTGYVAFTSLCRNWCHLGRRPFPPLVQNCFVQNIVVPFFCGADLCDGPWASCTCLSATSRPLTMA